MYSRLIAWLKILLPLAALALLSTLFLVSRESDAVATIPILTGGADPIQTEQLGRPFYAGLTNSGRGVTLTARQARFDGAQADDINADDVRAVFDTRDETQIVIEAPFGKTEDGTRVALRQGVTLNSSSGYTIRSEGFDAELDRLKIESTAQVDADGPGITLTAGKLRVDEDNSTQSIRLLFTGGVKMIYLPQQDGAEQ